ncbi:MAG TPA: oligoendopeptidase F [Anaerolineales bacterium]|nr:oligoendopeptidase F [Anaerolineales bacterium]
MAVSYPPRRKVEKGQTWNAESVFKNHKAWDEEVRNIVAEIEPFKKFKGRLGEGPAVLLEALAGLEGLMVRAQRVFMYAGFASAVDTTDQVAAGMQSQAGGMFGQVVAAVSFVRPELLAIGKMRLEEWMRQDSKLAVYAHFFDDLFRKQDHVRSGEVEELLGMLADPFQGPASTSSLIANADFQFAPAVTSQGKKRVVTQSSIHEILNQADRKARQTAWEHYMDRHLEFKNTLASNLTTSIKANVFYSRARKHESSLAASLFEQNVPVQVFHNLIDTFRKHLPVWHRYFEIRRRALGQRDIAYYDMWAPLAKKRIKLSFEQAVDMISEGLAPMGKEYVDVLRKGCLEERWVDWAPNKGKQNGAFSYGAPGTHPFIMMSFTNEYASLSTLAHELGHSMHSYLTWKNQPLAYADYSLFVAEVASNFHQAMVRGHLLKTVKDPNFQITLIEEAMSNFFRYFFQMPTLARFELETHQRVEKGEALTADSMIELMADLFAEGFGPKVKVDRPRVGMVWSTFGHLFQDYYVYQYATGISGAHALSGRILRGERGAVEDYLGFLRSGGSMYPLDVLRKAGVDLTTPKPVEETFAVMASYVDRLEELVR